MMDDRERMDLLERRLKDVEAELRAMRRFFAESMDPSSTKLSALRPGDQSARQASIRTSLTDRVRSRTSTRTSVQTEQAPRRTTDLESWIGQNALLVIGVLALIVTVGLALKYAFDRGWISPEVRVLGGLLCGVAVALYGERMLLRQGLGRYGAGLVGAGAAICYVALWAAAGPFQFVPGLVGLGALLVLAVLVFLTSLRHDREELAAFAAIGAFMAPVLLGRGDSLEMLLAYSALVSTAGGIAAWRKKWQSAFIIVVLGLFAIAWIAVGNNPNEPWLALYLLVGTAAAVLAARSRGWDRTETAAAVLGWSTILLAAAGADGSWHWLYALGPAGLAALFALPVVRHHSLDQLVRGQEDVSLRGVWRDLLLFGIAVLAWAATVMLAFGDAEPTIGAWVLAGIGIAWLAWAVHSRSPELLAAGLATVTLAVWRGFEPSLQPAGWGVLGLLAVVLSRGTTLSLARTMSPALIALALFRLPELLSTRPDVDPAFTGTWPLVAGVVLVAAVLAAGPAWTDPDPRVERIGGIPQRGILWTLAGTVLFFLVTVEIETLLQQRGASTLASGFAVSAWWLIYAGILLAWGFVRDVKAVRIAGLLVGGLALGKIVLHDLSSLEALYRIGSFALLAGVALLAARAYHRQARQDSETTDTSPGQEDAGQD
jgi:uncharacterized membrane protein